MTGYGKEKVAFAILADSHVDARPDPADASWWNRMLVTRSREILRAAVEELNGRKLDFAVHCGDLTNASDMESYREARRILDDLRMPLYVVPGNHDTWGAGIRSLAATLFGGEGGRLYRTVMRGGFRLILIDAAYWLWKDGTIHEHIDWERYVDIAVPESELLWLESELSRDADAPTLCFTHPVLALRNGYPVGRMPDGTAPGADRSAPPGQAPLMVSLDIEELFPGTKELKAVFRKAGCVKAVFSGHGHFHDWLVEDGIVYCQTGSLVEYPVEMREIRVTESGIETEVFGDSLKHFAKQSYVEEWGNGWTAGRDIDRKCEYRFGSGGERGS